MEFKVKIVFVYLIGIFASASVHASSVDLTENDANFDNATTVGFPGAGIFDSARQTIGLEVSVPGNTILDRVLLKAQAELNNLTQFRLPPFSFSSTLLSVKVPSSSIGGLLTFHRVGDTLLDMRPIGSSRIAFGLGWTEITAVFNLELYFLQPWVLVYGAKGTVSLRFTNISSTQAFTYDPLKFFVAVDEFKMGLGGAAIEITGFEPSGSLGGKALTQFVNENKDLFLGVLSAVGKNVVNACLNGIRSIILP